MSGGRGGVVLWAELAEIGRTMFRQRGRWQNHVLFYGARGTNYMDGSVFLMDVDQWGRHVCMIGRLWDHTVQPELGSFTLAWLVVAIMYP